MNKIGKGTSLFWRVLKLCTLGEFCPLFISLFVNPESRYRSSSFDVIHWMKASCVQENCIRKAARQSEMEWVAFYCGEALSVEVKLAERSDSDSLFMLFLLEYLVIPGCFECIAMGLWSIIKECNILRNMTLGILLYQKHCRNTQTQVAYDVYMLFPY